MNRMASDADRQRAREIAKAFLGGRISILEAARELVPLAYREAIAYEADRRLIIGIYSETDHLSVGEVRKLWAPEALKLKDVDIQAAENFWRVKLLEACNRIVERA